jgi:hypothetical protein
MFNNLGYQLGQNVQQHHLQQQQQQHQQYFNQAHLYNNQINHQPCASYEYNQSFSSQYNNQPYVNISQYQQSSSNYYNPQINPQINQVTDINYNHYNQQFNPSTYQAAQQQHHQQSIMCTREINNLNQPQVLLDLNQPINNPIINSEPKSQLKQQLNANVSELRQDNKEVSYFVNIMHSF